MNETSGALSLRRRYPGCVAAHARRLFGMTVGAEVRPFPRVNRVPVAGVT
jgi:hypothetical protein